LKTKLLICTLSVCSVLSFSGFSSLEANTSKEGQTLSELAKEKELSQKLEYKSLLLGILQKHQQIEARLQAAGLKSISDPVRIEIPLSLLLKSDSLGYLKNANIETSSLQELKKNSPNTKVQVALSSSEQLETLIQELLDQAELIRLQLFHVLDRK
jgi:hypothetical protein